jgi:peptide subunit release factor RF-3
MIGRILYGGFAVALVATTAVIAQPSAGDTAKSDANKQICRVIADTGSRLGRYRACHTAQEWIELRRQTKQNIDHIQNARPWNAG